MADVAHRLEQTLFDFFWVPPETVIVDRPELVYISSKHPHLNRVHRVSADPARIPALIAEVSAAHVGGSHFELADTTDLTEIGRALVNAGYTDVVEHIASVIEVVDHKGRDTDRVRAVRVETIEHLRDSIAVMDEVFGDASEWTEEGLLRRLKECVGPNARTWRFIAYDKHDKPISAGALTLYPVLNIGVLWGGSTLASARGIGAYSTLVRARLQAAQSVGINCVGLYAVSTTSAPIVARQGFRDVGRQWHWSRIE